MGKNVRTRALFNGTLGSSACGALLDRGLTFVGGRNQPRQVQLRTAAHDEVVSALGPVDAMGQERARRCVGQGSADADRMVVEFDDAASRMTESVERLRAVIGKSIVASPAEHSGANDAVAAEASWLAGVALCLDRGQPSPAASCAA